MFHDSWLLSWTFAAIFHWATWERICGSRALGGSGKPRTIFPQFLLYWAAYWMPVLRSCTYLVSVLLGSISAGLPAAALLDWKVAARLAFVFLNLERWLLRTLLEQCMLRGASLAACQQVQAEAQQRAGDFGAWPLHICRNLLHLLFPRVSVFIVPGTW